MVRSVFLTIAVGQWHREPEGFRHEASPLGFTWVLAWCFTMAESSTLPCFSTAISPSLLRRMSHIILFLPCFPVSGIFEVMGQTWQTKVFVCVCVVHLSYVVCLWSGPSDWDPEEHMNGVWSTSSSCWYAGSHLSIWSLLPLILALVLSFSVRFAMSSGIIVEILFLKKKVFFHWNHLLYFLVKLTTFYFSGKLFSAVILFMM